MAEQDLKQVMQDAILDADSLERFINGSDSETVLTRLSAEYPTLQKAIKTMFENGGIAGRFKTLVELQESDLVNGDYALVANDTGEKNGIYIKEGGAWTRLNSNIIFGEKTTYVNDIDGSIDSELNKLPTVGAVLSMAGRAFNTTYDIPMDTEGYYYAINGNFSAYRFLKTTGLFAVKKGDKVSYNSFVDSSASGGMGVLNLYNTNRNFIANIIPSDGHQDQVVEGVYVCEEDGFLAVSSYKAGPGEQAFVSVTSAKSFFATSANDGSEQAFVSYGDTCVVGTGSTVLMSGASFAYSSNGWFELMCSSLGVTGINKSASGHGIGHLASQLYNNTFYNQETLNSTDALIIMHAWNYNINARKDITINDTSYTDEQLELWTASDYEATGWSWLSAPPANDVWNDATMSAMWDYVLKKLQAIYYAEKDNAESKWHGTTHGKPFNVVLSTSWHDGRVAFNTSIRKLASKWGCALIEFDKNIGFSKDKPHVSGVQHSRLYERGGNNPEIINGVTYGWHYQGGQDEPLVRRMAGIAKSVFEVV